MVVTLTLFQDRSPSCSWGHLSLWDHVEWVGVTPSLRAGTTPGMGSRCERGMSNFFHLPITRVSDARGGIRTHGPLRDRILSPAPLAELGYPRSKSAITYSPSHVLSPTPGRRRRKPDPATVLQDDSRAQRYLRRARRLGLPWRETVTRTVPKSPTGTSGPTRTA